MNVSPDLFRDIALILAGGLVSGLTGLLTSIVLYWLEGQREHSRERKALRREDYRTALRYAQSGRQESLAGAELKEADLAYADLAGCDLRHADLRRAHLYKANLSKAILAYANLEGATLVEANLREADLFGANLKAANLTDADLSGAGMLLAQLGGAKLLRTNLEGAVLEGYDAVKGYISADLSDVDLSTAKFSSQSQEPSNNSEESPLLGNARKAN